MKQLWSSGEDFIWFVVVVCIMFFISHTLLPFGHTVTKYELERAQEFCGDSGIYKINTYIENSVTCNNGDEVFFKSLMDDDKKGFIIKSK